MTENPSNSQALHLNALSKQKHPRLKQTLSVRPIGEADLGGVFGYGYYVNTANTANISYINQLAIASRVL